MNSSKARNGGVAGIRTRRSIPWLLASAAAFPAVFSPNLRADVTWNPSISSGNWNTPSNWLGGSLPSNSDNIYIAFNDSSTSHTITYNGTISSTASLFFGNIGAGNAILTVPNGFTLSASVIDVGSGGRGQLDQNGGMVTGTSAAEVSLFAGAPAIYNLTGGTLNVVGTSTTGGLIVGQSGAGTFNQSSGLVSVTNRMYLGNTAGSFGVYNLTGGTLNVGGAQDIGFAGGGIFNQSGGTHNLSSIMEVGKSAGSSGFYTLSGTGVLIVASDEFIARDGTGAFIQTGGLNSGGANLYIGRNTDGGPGTYLLSGNGSLNITASEFVGNNVNGTFTHLSGTNTIGGSLTVGQNFGSTGAYTLNGTSVVVVAGEENVGRIGNGFFYQNGGTHTVGTTGSPQDLYVGRLITSGGSYLLAGGQFTVSGRENVGVIGQGTFTQTGGTNSAVGGLSLALQSGITGTYTLNGAGALLTVGNSAYVGGSDAAAGGTGILNVQNGSMTVAGNLKIWDTGTNAVHLSGGVLSVGTLDTSGNPSRFSWTTGTLAVTGAGGLAVGSGAPLGNSLTLNANHSLNVTNTITNNGTLNLNGGTYTFGGLINNGTLNYQNSSTITGSVTNSGTVSGLDGAQGSLTVSTLQLNAGGTLKFDLAAPATSDVLVVLTANGLNLAGATSINLINLGSLTDGTYTLIDYAGTFAGTLGNLSLGTTPGGFNYTLQNDTGNTAIELIVASILQNPVIWLSGTGNWSNSSKWNSGVVPNNSVLHVLIDNSSGPASAVTLDQNATVGDVTLDPGETLSIDATRTLTLAGPNTSSFSGALSNAGTLAITGGTTLLSGGGNDSGAFAISSGATLNFAGGTHNLSAFHISGPGTMSLTGGTLHTSAVNPTLGGPAASSSMVSMTGGTWVSDSSEIIADSGAASFTQSAGLHTNSGMSLGNSATGNGTYLLSGGTLNSSGNLLLGPGGTGTLTLNGASAVANLASVYVGGSSVAPGGSGVVNIQNGTMNASGTFKIWDTGSSAVNFSGGLLSVGTLNTSGNPSRLNWTTGTLAISGAGGLTIGAAAPLGSSLTLNPNRTLNVTNTLTNNGTLTLSGGTYQIGGLANNGTLNYQNSVIITGNVTNSGTISGFDNALGSLTVNSLLLSSGILKFDLAAPTTSDEILVLTSNGLNLAGPTNIDLANIGGLAAGTYTLLDYSGTFAGLLSNLSVTTAPSGFNYSLQNNTGGTTIDLVVTVQQAGTPGIWLGGTGNWSDTSKWTNGTIPIDSSFHVQIDAANAAASIVTLDQNATVADVTLDADDILNISTTRTLALTGLNTSTFSGMLNNAGTLALTGSAILNNAGSHSGAFALSAATLDFHAGTHTLSSTSSFSGTGTLAFTGATINAHHLTLGTAAADNLTLNQMAGIASIGTLALGNNGTLTGGSGIAHATLSGGTLTATSILLGSSTGGRAKLTITGTAHVETNALAIAPAGTTFAGTLDLTNRPFIVHSGDINNLTTLTKSGYNTGTWNGSGITSSIAASNPSQGLGLITGSDFLLLHPDVTTFDGTTISPADVLFKLTWQGDADLDGYITMNDYSLLEAGFFFGNFNGNAGNNPATWVHGDFNYDGVVNFQDYALIDAAFQSQSGTLANDEISAHTAQFGLSYSQFLTTLSTAVPEPASLTLLLLATPSLLRRKRRI